MTPWLGNGVLPPADVTPGSGAKAWWWFLQLDPGQVEFVGSDPRAARAGQRVLGGVRSILNGINGLRNASGTGHVRSDAPELDGALARLAIGAALAAAVYLVESYEAMQDGFDGEAPV